MEFLDYDFIRRAFWVGSLCALVAGFLGNFLVASRHTITSEMISHSALAGVGLGFLIDTAPDLTAVLFSLGTTLLLFFLTRNQQKINEGIAVMLLSGGVALALLWVHFAKDNPTSFQKFLFGSILTTTPEEAVFFSGMSIVLLLILFFFGNRFMSMVFDYEAFKTKPHSLFFELIFMLMIGVFVSLSLKIIGSLLISALLVIPVITAQNLVWQFRKSIICSIILNLMAIVIGILSSYYLDVPTSSGIVLSLIAFFVLSMVGKQLR